MKRSTAINVARMRKNPWGHLRLVSRIAVASGGVAMLAGCSSDEGVIYETVRDCVFDNPDDAAECQLSYMDAKRQWQDSAPRYRYENHCESEFGREQCEEHQSNYLPLMTGFMLLDLDDGLKFKKPKPLGRSTNRHSKLYDRWVGAGGKTYGRYPTARVSVDKSDFKRLKGSNRVLGRGGFGRTVSSRSSSWGG